MILQAFFDDSGSEPKSPAYVVAGWLASVPQWESFSDAWQAELASRPRSIEYFKMSEAMGLKGQFQGWNHLIRDDKILSLGKVIAQHELIRIGAGVHRRVYDDLIASTAFPRTYFGNPYFMMFYECIMLVGRTLKDITNPVERVDIIFDEQGKVGNRAKRYWSKAMESFKKLDRIDGMSLMELDCIREPRFENDKAFRPLQAADMYAWMGRDRGASALPRGCDAT